MGRKKKDPGSKSVVIVEGWALVDRVLWDTIYPTRKEAAAIGLRRGYFICKVRVETTVMKYRLTGSFHAQS